MAAFIPLIAAGIAAAATVYSTEANRGKGKSMAPAFGGGGGTPKGAIETPDPFGSGGKGGGMLGGGGSKPVASLSQSLSGSSAPQQFGPSKELSDEELRMQLSRLMSAGG